MKHALLTLFSLFFGALLFFASCQCQIESDAEKLAEIHLRRTVVILQILKSADSTEIRQGMREARLLDSEFHQLKQTFDNKYADPADRVRFEKAYANAMKKN